MDFFKLINIFDMHTFDRNRFIKGKLYIQKARLNNIAERLVNA